MNEIDKSTIVCSVVDCRLHPKSKRRSDKLENSYQVRDRKPIKPKVVVGVLFVPSLRRSTPVAISNYG